MTRKEKIERMARLQEQIDELNDLYQGVQEGNRLSIAQTLHALEKTDSFIEIIDCLLAELEENLTFKNAELDALEKESEE